MLLKLLFLIFWSLANVCIASKCSSENSKTIDYKNHCYRTFDGYNNNLKNPKWANANTSYARLIDNSYSDGKHAFPRSVTGEELISPRQLSLLLAADVPVKDPFMWTLFTVMWGQFTAHDMSFASSPQDSVTCCTQDSKLVNVTNPRCNPIVLPKDDPYNGPEGRQCMPFTRSTATYVENCPECPKEPITAVTGYIDLSLVYGNSKDESDSLRTFEDGQLKNTYIHNKQYPYTVEGSCPKKNIRQNYCFKAGDARVNQNLELALLHIVMFRAHNKMAATLCTSINPHWNDEICYQEARRILTAMTQHITYNEYLPIILGKENMKANNLTSEKPDTYTEGYDETIDASVLLEHATAAFRMFHSTIVNHIELKKKYKCTSTDFTSEKNLTSAGVLKISDWMNNVSVLTLDHIELLFTLGLSSDSQGNVDRFYTSGVTQFLFKRDDKYLGNDLVAADIKRTRDHGIGTYVEACNECGIYSPETWEDLKEFISEGNVELLKLIYKDIRDIELLVGGLLENPLPFYGIKSGPVFNCILTEQFYRTKFGDRFYYGSSSQPCPFPHKQLNSIKTVTLSSLLCEHIYGLDSIQKKAFSTISKTNPIVKCDSIPKIDLMLWKE